MRLFFILFSTYFMIPLTLGGQTRPKCRLILPAEIKEASGVVVKQEKPYPVYWVVNDGENAPVLYAVSGKNRQILQKTPVPFRNNDWEDLTSDNKGNLYFGDFGNNLNDRKDLRIYILNPQTMRKDSILFRYSDQKIFPPKSQKNWNYDCEAMVYMNDSLHLFSKNRFVGNFYTKHYVLPARPGNFVAQLRDSILLKGHVVTGAGMSKDGKTLALVSYYFERKWKYWPVSRSAVWFFEGYKGSAFFKGKLKKKKLRKFVLSRQNEGIAHVGGAHWVVANERMLWNKASIRRVKHKNRSKLGLQ